MKIFSDEMVSEAARVNHVADLSHATIGETLLVAQYLEQKTGIPFIRMDQGSPGLPANKYGIEAEKRALDSGIGSQYPAAAGVKELKDAFLALYKPSAYMDYYFLFQSENPSGILNYLQMHPHNQACLLHSSFHLVPLPYDR